MSVPRGKAEAVTAIGHRADDPRFALQQARLPAGRGVPEAYGGVPSGGRHLLAVGVEGDVVDEVLVAAQDSSFNLADFPDAQRAFGGAGHQSGTVGREDGWTFVGKNIFVSAEH